jgi:hypothetical protein
MDQRSRLRADGVNDVLPTIPAMPTGVRRCLIGSK